MPTIAVVTDTSSDLLPDEAVRDDIRLVPLTVSFGEDSFDAVTGLDNESFYARLTAPGAPFPRTAAPSPAAFEAAYRDAFDEGADGVICVTISSKLSATYAAAVRGAETFGTERVSVVDSKSVTHSLALLAQHAAAVARGGADLSEVTAQVVELRARSAIYFCVDTLEYLQRGGRIGRASALLGTVLSIKPILWIDDGEVATADKKRTTSKARARLLEIVSEQPLERAVALHTMTPDVEQFAHDLAVATGLDRSRVRIGLAGPVAGAHAGPGMLGVSLIRTA